MRKLAAIMFTDIVGYTALMGKDEQKALQLLQKNRGLLRPIIEQFRGEWLKEMGDGTLSAFGSAVDAVNCALQIQQIFKGDPELSLRIGIHLGDVVFEEGDVFGEGVNIASRIEPLAEPGSVCVSEQVYEAIHNKPDIEATSLGEKKLKGVDRPVKVYAVTEIRAALAKPAPEVPQALSRRWWAWAAIGVVAVAVAVVVLFYLRGRPAGGVPEPALGDKSIAVLPFQNLSPDPENEYFSDGMTEELISKLARIQNLQVVSRTSVARFKGTQQGIKEIGEELAVRYVLEGSVRKAGNRVRITAQLIDASTDFHLWSDDFDGELQDVFAVQEETALKIAEALDLHLSPQETETVRRRYTQNPEAYDSYLRGWALIESFILGFDRPEKLEAARKHFEQALALDPDYPLALTGVSQVEVFYYWIGEGTPDHLQRAEELARRALTLSPELSEARAALGDVYGIREDWESAIDEYRQALRLDPRNAYAWEELAWALNFQQPPDPKDAEKAAREAIQLEPGWFWAYYQLGVALALQMHFEDAIATFQHALQLNQAFRSAYLYLGEIYLDQGDYSQALAQYDEARRIRETPGLIVLISAAYAALGDKEKALAELEEALVDGYRDFAWIDASPHFAALRSDPRFQQLVSEYEGK